MSEIKDERNKRKLKDFLLSSGLPLEYSVKKCLEELGLNPSGEYSYEGKNELGVPAYFLIDLTTLSFGNMSDELLPLLELVIECKYRFENIDWIFTPAIFDGLSRYGNYDNEFIIMDEITENKELDRKQFSNFLNNYKFCDKGVEILSNGVNSKSLNQGIHQLKFAASEKNG